MHPASKPIDSQAIVLLRHMSETGVPLRSYCEGQLYQGLRINVKSAFVVDSRTRDLLVTQDRRSAEVLGPFLVTRDLRAWQLDWHQNWLIAAYPGVALESYPAVWAYLCTFKPDLERRSSPQTRTWHELERSSVRLVEAMKKPKLIYPALTNAPKVALDHLGHYYLGTGLHFIPRADHYLQGILGSRVLWHYLTQVAQMRNVGFYRLDRRIMGDLPVPTPSEEEQGAVAALAERLSAPGCPDRLDLEAELDERVASLYGLTAADMRLVEGLSLQMEATNSGGDA